MKKIVCGEAFLSFIAENRLFTQERGDQRLKQGDVVRVPDGAEIERYAHFFIGFDLPLKLGAFSYSRSPFSPHMRIGRYCSIAGGLTILGDQHPERVSTSPFSYDIDLLPGMRASLDDMGAPDYRPSPFDRGEYGAEIGHDVRIGEGVVLERGVSIGTGAIVADEALVTKDVPPYAIVGGAPAEIIRYRFGPELIQELLDAAWWRFHSQALTRLGVDQPEGFAERLSRAVERGDAVPFEPGLIDFAAF